MDSRKAVQTGVAFAVAAVMLLFGYLVSTLGFKVLRDWSSISVLYAACGALWIVAGPAMLGAGAWILASFAPQRRPLFVGGAAAFVAGAVLVVGVLTYVVPCAGPS